MMILFDTFLDIGAGQIGQSAADPLVQPRLVLLQTDLISKLFHDTFYRYFKAALFGIPDAISAPGIFSV